MKSEFRTDYIPKFLGRGKMGTYLWKLTTPLVFYSLVLGREVIAEAGFITNATSVFYKTDPRPAVIHDKLWSDPDIPRSLGNAVYLEAMNVTGDVGKFRRYIRYGVVSISQFFWKQGEP